ncbi:LacI family DNA-binding transcriptional regulator [Bacillus idriensis]|uniref:LacI family DNA-binding transcriptional regulator n=2 Tax=Metabacillus idriensis TaxID=324768 RepID=A0A6I2MES3_9BACI|nr:LacI family DNA-binding transcriptional regulator [Metabacillus idriensis]
MQDIADKLKISKNSVSQALTGKPGVSEETRLLVQKTAEELGYAYPSGRKNGNNGQTGTIALLASVRAFSFKSFFGEIYLSIEKELKSRGMNLLILSVDNEEKETLKLPDVIEDRSVDGILILSHLTTDYINKVLDTGIPTVMIDHHDPLNQADAILTNNRFGGYEMVKHLIDLGHREIGFIGNIDYSPSYQERWEGYQLALRRHGIEPANQWMYLQADEDEVKIHAFLSNLDQKPTAWFCVNDGLGFITMTTLQRLGYTVPDNVSVGCFDNGQLSRIANPKITTMDIDLSLFGKKAVEQLFWRMDNKEEPFQETLLPARLVKRESAAEVSDDRM